MKPELQYLKENFKQSDEATNHLVSSLNRCKDFIFNETFTEEQLVELEALTSRFARVSDLLIQKILKTIDEIEGTTPGTVRDRLLQAEKKSIIINADDFMEIRKIRNRIAHEYETDALRDIFVFAFNNSALLIDSIKTAKEYSQKFYTE
ncbi:MAG: hypothetical protein ABI834_00320 [Ginsengibacter sp.]